MLLSDTSTWTAINEATEYGSPLPIIFGSAFDRNCRLRRTPDEASGNKSCLFYHNNLMSDYMVDNEFACKSCACLLFLSSYPLYKRHDERRTLSVGTLNSQWNLMLPASDTGQSGEEEMLSPDAYVWSSVEFVTTR